MKSTTPILFMGTPQFAAVALRGLVEADFNVIGVICRPDAQSGRGGTLTAPGTKLVANGYKIPVFQPANKGALTEIVNKLQPELIVVAAYGMIVPQAVLDIPKYGALNIHGSLLPAYRGASPITEAILNGDKETGITIMKMSLGMDEGAIINQYKLSVRHPEPCEGSRTQILDSSYGQNDGENKFDTTESLTEKMAELGAKAIIDTIPRWISGELKAKPQNGAKATYCKKITKEDGHIDWNQPAELIERMIRAYTPWPTAYTFMGDRRVKILRASVCHPERTKDPGLVITESGHLYIGTGKGTLEITELQPEGKKPMNAKNFINGNTSLDESTLG